MVKILKSQNTNVMTLKYCGFYIKCSWIN